MSNLIKGRMASSPDADKINDDMFNELFAAANRRRMLRRRRHIEAMMTPKERLERQRDQVRYVVCIF